MSDEQWPAFMLGIEFGLILACGAVMAAKWISSLSKAEQKR